MTTNPTVEAPPERRGRGRRRWWWAAVAVVATPPLLLAAVGWSYFALPGEATALRDAVMRSTAAEWRTMLQADVGIVTLAAMRAAIGSVQAPGIEDAKLALGGVERASAGVYRRSGGADGAHDARVAAAADAAMRRRGWQRVIAVTEGARGDTVLVYTPVQARNDDALEVCLAVLNARELVVARATVRPEALGELVARHAPTEWNRRQDGRDGIASR